MNWIKRAQEEIKKQYESPGLTTYDRPRKTVRTHYSPATVKDIEEVIQERDLDCTVEEFANDPNVDWKRVSEYRNLSEDFIREFANKVDWTSISRNQRLSEDFIREFADKVGWYFISWFQNLSEDFIREFADEVDWTNISIHHELSEDLIREFADKLDWDWVLQYQKLSPEFKREMKELGYLY